VRAIVFEDRGHVRVADVPEPEVSSPADAIVRVTVTSICGSDLHFFHGKAPIDRGEILGHEAIGVVETVGDGVGRFRPGDRVVASFHIACGRCWFCARGETSLCDDDAVLGAGPFGGGLAGAQAERVRIPNADVNLLAVPDTVDDERALFVGDVLTTGVYAAAIADAATGDTVAIVGIGPVGFCTAQALGAAGVAPVYALDVDPSRVRLAEVAGAIAIDAGTTNPEMALARVTGDRGADVVIEAVGSTSAFGTALGIVRRGGRVVVVGMYAGEVVELQLGVYWARALDVRFAGLCPVHAYWERTMSLVAEGQLDPLPLVSHRLPLEDGPKGYELFDRREATKVLLHP